MTTLWRMSAASACVHVNEFGQLSAWSNACKLPAGGLFRPEGKGCALSRRPIPGDTEPVNPQSVQSVRRCKVKGIRARGVLHNSIAGRTGNAEVLAQLAGAIHAQANRLQSSSSKHAMQLLS